MGYKDFIKSIVNKKYVLTDNDTVSTNLIFSSEWVNPRLQQTENVYFKINYLANILSNELYKKGHKITSTEIKGKLRFNDIVVYHERIFDKDANRDADYFFLIDIRTFRSFVYKWFPAISPEKDDGFNKLNRTLKASEISADEFFHNAACLSETSLSDLEIISSKEIISELIKENASLVIYLENDKVLPYIKEKTEIEIPMQKINKYYINIISTDKPLISSKVEIVLQNSKNKFYHISGEIIREKTISIDKYYELNFDISFTSREKILNAKAIFAFIEYEKNKK